jgi:hypothetical protein
MRQIPIYQDNNEFRREIKRSGDGKVPPLIGKALAEVPVTASILVGERSREFGGGLAGTGYVMDAGRAIGSVSIGPEDVKRGVLIVK